MVSKTFPFRPRDKPKPIDEPLPSIPPEKMDTHQSPAEQLRHSNEQIALTRTYPGRTPRSCVGVPSQVITLFRWPLSRSLELGV
jgi:hypothetical protein